MKISTLIAAGLIGGTVTLLPHPQRAIQLTRELRIDGVAESLGVVRAIAVNRDGRIIVTQPIEQHLRVYSEDGKALGRVGRLGQGPGEFENATAAGWFEDSLWAYDIRARRVSVFAPDLSFVRQFSAASMRPVAGAESRFPSAQLYRPYAITSDGTLLVSAPGGVRNVPPGFDTTGTLVFRLRPPDLLSGIPIRARPKPNGVVILRPGMEWATPLFAAPLLRVSAGGEKVVELSFDYDAGPAAAMRLTLFSGTGDTLYSRDVAFSPERLSARVADSALTASITLMQSVSKQSGLANQSELLESGLRQKMRIPSIYPPFTSVLVADVGTVWIGLYTRPGAAERYLVLDARGNALGVATLPLRTTPLLISSTHMWGIELDQDDVASVVRYRVR